MNLPLEIRALFCALVVAALSLGGAWLLAGAIKKLPVSTFGPESGPAVEISTSPYVIHQGGGFFATSCTECHGDDAHGDEGPDLHHLAISNARISATIHKGVKGQMPPFAKKYTDAQITAIISYLRTLD